MRVDISGTRNGVCWPKRGQVIDLPEHEAIDMLNAGLVKAVVDPPTEEVAAVSVDAETRPKPARRKKSSG